VLIRRARLTFVATALVILQTTLLEHLRIFDAVPDLLLVATIAVAVEDGADSGALFGFLSGLLVDLFLSTPLGLSALAFSVTGYAIGVLQGGLVYSSAWLAPFFSAIGGVVGGFLFAFAGAVTGEHELLTGFHIRVLLLAAVYDAVVSIPLFRLVQWAARDQNQYRRRA
jgi:rod shape-determining protein MreD